MKILVVDDDKISGKLLKIILQGFGCEVILVNNGKFALEVFRTVQPDMVLLDVMMPGMDGYETARQIKKLSGENFVPVIFVSSLNNSEDIRKAIDAGGDDFLFKPYNKEILKAKIDAMNRIRGYNVELQKHKKKLEEHTRQQQRELKLAEHIFRNIVDSGSSDISGVRRWVSSASVFCGDLLLCTKSPSGNIHILLGDFTGHGLTAAIGALPASDIFYGMSNKGFSISEIATELNKKLFTLLPTDIFCAACLFEVNSSKGTLGIWNGGLPKVYCKSGITGKVNAHVSRNPPLGILNASSFDSEVEIIDLDGNERIYAYTDGLVQSENKDKIRFSGEMLEQTLEDGSKEDDLFESVKKISCELLAGCEPQDDISVVEINISNIKQSCNSDQELVDV